MRCNICGHATNTNKNSLYLDCGGDCLLCMADAGDLDCIQSVAKIARKQAAMLETVKTNLYRGLSHSMQRVQARAIEEVLRGDWR